MIWPQQVPTFPPLPSTDPNHPIVPIQPVQAVQAPETHQHPPLPPHPAPSDPLSVAAWMQSVVITCSPEQSLGELMELLTLHHISGAPVVSEEGQLLGVVSQTDVAAFLGGLYGTEIRGASGFYRGVLGSFRTLDPAAQSLLESETVANLLSPHVHSVTPQANLNEVVDLMLREHVHRLPVVDQGRLVGVISTLDVLRVFRDSHRA